MQRLDLAVNEKLSKKLISDRPSLGNIDLLKKYYSSISTLIYESRLHFKHLPLGYFIRHLYVYFLCFLWTQYQITISQIKILRYSTLFLNQFCIEIILLLSYFHIEQRNTYILIIYKGFRMRFNSTFPRQVDNLAAGVLRLVILKTLHISISQKN